MLLRVTMSSLVTKPWRLNGQVQWEVAAGAGVQRAATGRYLLHVNHVSFKETWG